MVKRTAAAEYDVRRQKFAALNLKDGDTLIQAFPAMPGQDILLISRDGQSIRFALDTVPAMGRASGGVKAIQLEGSDTVTWSGQVSADNQLILFSDRGNAKRVLAMEFEVQGRNGKGVRAFSFNKNGSNGTFVAGCVSIGKEPVSLVVLQAQSAPTFLSSEEIVLQSKSDRGKPYVMALMDDVVTGLIAGVSVSVTP